MYAQSAEGRAGACCWRAALLLLLWVSAAGALEWQIEVVDSIPVNSPMLNRAIRVDSQGRPHVAYGGTVVHYAWRDSLGWHHETVDSLQGWDASLDLDDQDQPHLSFGGGGYLNYARKQGSGWVVDSVAPGGAASTSVELDAAGYPHIGYVTGYPDSVMYAHKDSSGWHREKALGGVFWQESYSHVSLAVDSVGYPHISCVMCDHWGYYTTHYARKDAAGWHGAGVDQGVTGPGTSIAIDESGLRHFSYFGDWGWVWSQDLVYAYIDALGWHHELADGPGNVGTYSSLALGDEGDPHLSYYDHSNSALKYAYRSASGWHAETVDTGGQRSSLALHGDGWPHIIYQTGAARVVKYAYGWIPQITLAGSVQGGALVLTWIPVAGASAYWVYGAADDAYFPPGPSPGYLHRLAVLSPLFRTWSSTSGIADPDSNWTYLVVAVDATEQEVARSNRVGEHDFSNALSDPTSSTMTDFLLSAPRRRTTKDKTKDELSH